MADALASGASVRKDVGVQVPPRAPRSIGLRFSCVDVVGTPERRIRAQTWAISSYCNEVTELLLSLSYKHCAEQNEAEL